eukprot:scaffold34800_cov16-Tisochrysis_lutea.AAC.1
MTVGRLKLNRQLRHPTPLSALRSLSSWKGFSTAMSSAPSSSSIPSYTAWSKFTFKQVRYESQCLACVRDKMAYCNTQHHETRVN